ncbi:MULTISPECIES: 3-dehydroquinate synthase [unclassified Beijerinckia]|uniref:3-dehydroquinate synthase n=1 Tax=unclassified Beijerinckia TaxID=2638183 RepID=UPI000895C6EC|nr:MULTISPECIES: 3-dehydroquinate synthase [unclassified Beijerinckia]MDH7798124.1 shikimate kinase/3-dehydroquinate synthase [Beijerinckia sp. GAS462]SED09903.1 3-dehydroquinate synthase [Beijerinckia sp. 28-YEA-48]
MLTEVDPRAASIVRQLRGRSIVLVGMMGSGKTSVGRRLAQRLGLDFVDADHEIEAAAGMTIPEIFSRNGENYFRDGERRVMARLLAEKQRVLATGGGAFMQVQTRENIARHGISVWLNADVDVLARRVRKRTNRPILHTANPEETLRKLIDERGPIYAQADLSVVSIDGPHDVVVDAILDKLSNSLDRLVHQETPTQATVRVELDERAYDIIIGQDLIASAGRHIAALFPKSACAIVTDENLAREHLPALERGLDAHGIRHARIVITPGEPSKCWSTFARVCDDIIAAKMERGDLVVALGGGVVGDLAGFAAATVRRGMRFVQIPTSLLAQVDSSVGGKTAINSEHGKNLIGAFYQPSLVLADTGALATLPPREFRAGYAEIVKYGLIDDAPFFDWLTTHWQAIFARGPELVEAIRKSCASKAAVVARDETEQGDRALLNLGHTFGHALETLLHYDSERLVHGEGVAIGVACAARFSAKLGYANAADAERVEAHLRECGLPSSITHIKGWNHGPDQILEAMFQDKKVQRGSLTFILMHGIGRSFIARGVDAAQVREFLTEELARS